MTDPGSIQQIRGDIDGRRGHSGGRGCGGCGVPFACNQGCWGGCTPFSCYSSCGWQSNFCGSCGCNPCCCNPGWQGWQLGPCGCCNSCGFQCGQPAWNFGCSSCHGSTFKKCHKKDKHCRVKVISGTHF